MKNIYIKKVAPLLFVSAAVLMCCPVPVKAAGARCSSTMAAPPSIDNQTFSIRDDSPVGTVAGQLTATGSNLQWILEDDGSKGAFDLDASGRLIVKDAARLQANRGNIVSVYVMVSDGVSNSNMAEITVAIQDTYINIPPTLDPIADKGACAGTAVDTIYLTGMSAVEPDQTYSLVAVADAPLLQQLNVTHEGVLTYQLKGGILGGSCMITVMIKDNGGIRNGGQDTRIRTFTLTVNRLPNVSIGSDKGTVIAKGDQLTLTATGGDQYQWRAAAGIVGETATASIQVRPTVNTRYIVVATNNAGGCSDTAAIDIRLLGDFVVRANNVVSPNGDGRNDLWKIENIADYPENELTIVDRAGRTVYSQKNYNNNWNAYMNGQRLAEGTYYYIFRVKNPVTKATDIARGFITVVVGD